MNTLPRISIITPVLNGKAFIAKAIDSVLSQNYPDLEYIIVDAGSTDGTQEIIKSYGDKITLILDADDQGPYDAYNKAIVRATGTIIGMLSADDWLSPSTLLRVGQIFAAQPTTDMVSVATQLHFLSPTNNTLTPGRIYSKEQYALTPEMVCKEALPNSRFIKKAVYEHYGVFKLSDAQTTYFLSSDIDLMLRFALNEVKNVIDNQVGYNFLVHHSSLTAGNNWNNKLQGYIEKISILNNALTQPNLRSQQRNVLEKSLQSTYMYLITRGLYSGQFTIAKQYLREATNRFKGACIYSFIKEIFINIPVIGSRKIFMNYIKPHFIKVKEC